MKCILKAAWRNALSECLRIALDCMDLAEVIENFAHFVKTRREHRLDCAAHIFSRTIKAEHKAQPTPHAGLVRSDNQTTRSSEHGFL